MVDGGLSHLGPLPNTHLKSCLEVGRPTLDSPKGPVMVGRPIVEDTYGARARGGCREEVCGCPNRADFGLHQDLSPLTPNTKVLTDEALMEEASRYIGSHSWSFFALGKRDFSSSFSLSRRDGMFVAMLRSGLYFGNSWRNRVGSSKDDHGGWKGDEGLWVG